MDEDQVRQYCCPGERAPISRAVHLGRLTRCYPACRQCAHRDDTGPLLPRQVKRLAMARRHGVQEPLFGDEGAAGVLHNELDAVTARNLAAALAIYLRGRSAAPGEPAVVLASDGRVQAPGIVAAVAEGLRWAGCTAIDLGQATAPCVAFAIAHLPAAGGILVGNSPGRAETVGLKFWGHGARPLSAGDGLDELRDIFLGRRDRPTRRFGALQRFQAEATYLAGLAEHYHALRPLRFVVDTDCQAVLDYLAQLTRTVACHIMPRRGRPEHIPEQVRQDRAHFAVRIDDDGERWSVWDEQGRAARGEQLLTLLACDLLTRMPGARIAVEQQTRTHCRRAIERAGGKVLSSGACRAAMARAMRESGAVFGGGPSGRLWFGRNEVAGYVAMTLGCADPTPESLPCPAFPAADALASLTLLLVLLSRSDRPLSAVLDAALPPG